MTLPDNPTVDDQEDRDLLETESIQDTWSNVSKSTDKAGKSPLGRFTDNLSRCFEVLIASEEIPRCRNADDDVALINGYTTDDLAIRDQ